MTMPYVWRGLDGTHLTNEGAIANAPHTHADAANGGQLDWDNVWSDGVHDHTSNAEGGTLPTTTRNISVPLVLDDAGAGPAVDGTWSLPFFALDDASTSRVRGFACLPQDYASGQLTVRFRYLSDADTSDNVRLEGALEYDRAGSDPNDVLGGASTSTETLPASTGLIKEFAFTGSVAPTAGDWLHVTFSRFGADAADTATGDIKLLPVAEIEYTATR